MPLPSRLLVAPERVRQVSDEQLGHLEEVSKAYSYVLMRLEFLEAALAWLCLWNPSDVLSREKEIAMAHSCLYTGLWVTTPPEEEMETMKVFVSKGSSAVN
jgi:hypothetical protein